LELLSKGKIARDEPKLITLLFCAYAWAKTRKEEEERKIASCMALVALP